MPPRLRGFAVPGNGPKAGAVKFTLCRQPAKVLRLLKRGEGRRRARTGWRNRSCLSRGRAPARARRRRLWAHSLPVGVAERLCGVSCDPLHAKAANGSKCGLPRKGRNNPAFDAEAVMLLEIKWPRHFAQRKSRPPLIVVVVGVKSLAVAVAPDLPVSAAFVTASTNEPLHVAFHINNCSTLSATALRKSPPLASVTALPRAFCRRSSCLSSLV